MWKDIANENDLKNFMDAMYGFHDSCIKEIKYISYLRLSDGTWIRCYGWGSKQVGMHACACCRSCMDSARGISYLLSPRGACRMA